MSAGERAQRRRVLRECADALDVINVGIVEVFHSLGRVTDVDAGYAELVGDVESSMVKLVDAIDAFTYRVQQDQERGR